jgi:hypothetical protein
VSAPAYRTGYCVLHFRFLLAFVQLLSTLLTRCRRLYIACLLYLLTLLLLRSLRERRSCKSGCSHGNLYIMGYLALRFLLAFVQLLSTLFARCRRLYIACLLYLLTWVGAAQSVCSRGSYRITSCYGLYLWPYYRSWLS